MKIFAALAVCLVATPVYAHPDDNLVQVRLALGEWAASMINGDEEQFRSVVFSQDIPMPRFSQVFLRYASYLDRGTTVRVEPIVLYTDNGTNQLSIWLELAEVGGQWKTTGFGLSDQFPEALRRKRLPEHVATRPVAFSLRDAKTGEATYARVRITDADGDYWPPRGHQKHVPVGWRQDVGGDVTIGDKTFAYVAPRFVADLPAGDLVVEVHKGMEYEPTLVSIAAGENAPVIEIKRWTDSNASGWYSGDTHVHFLDDHHSLLEIRAEDLNVINVLATKWGELITDVDRFTGGPSPLSVPGHVVYFNEETRHSWLGHLVLHRLTELVYPLTWGGPSEGVRGGYDYPPMAHQADKTHAQGGLVTWAHFPGPSGELPIDIALGKIDSVDLFTWGDPFAGANNMPSPVEWWYKFLNTGSRLGATGGTDKMSNNQVVGSVRTYAYVGEQFSYDRWADALKEGRTFVTTGPQISLKANDEAIGATLTLSRGQRVKLEAQVLAPHNLYPVDVLEIVRGGEVIARKENTDGESRLSIAIDVEVEGSTWVAARARGSTPLPYQSGIPPIAHTSPIYISVADSVVWSDADADWLAARVLLAIDWANNQAQFQNARQREEMLDLFQEALQIYRKNTPSTNGE